jgi:integrase
LYHYLLEGHLVPAFGRSALADIKATDVAAWQRRLVAELPGTAPKAYRLMAQLMGAAVKDERILRSPCSVKGASSEQRKEQAIPTVAEVDALAAAVPERYKVMVLLASWCSLRFGELAALRRCRIDVMHAQIEVAETVTELVTGERFAGPPKTAAGRRTVTIPPHLDPLVENHLRSVGPAPDALVFPSPEGGYLQRHNFRNRVWAPALKATGLSYRFHDLRHSGLTWVAATGATVAELMHRGGHASPAAAMRYQHATKERDRALAQALSELVKPAQVVQLSQRADGSAT